MKQVHFHKSMADDSHTGFAYLREALLPYANRLVGRAKPESDFDDTVRPTAIMHSNNDMYAFGPDATDTLCAYEISGNDVELDNKVAGTAHAPRIECAEYYDNGAGNKIWLLDEDGDLHTFNTSGDVFALNIQTEGGSGQQSMTYHPAYDSLFFVTGHKVYKQNGTTYDGKVFDLPEETSSTYDIIPYKSQVVFVSYDRLGRTRVSAWSGKSTDTGFDWDYTVGQGKPMACAVLNGVLTVVVYNDVSINKDEYEAKMEVYVFTGGGFRLKNSILLTGTATSYNSAEYMKWYTTDGNDIYVYMPRGADDGDGTPRKGIFKVSSNGAIELVDKQYTTDFMALDFFDGELFMVSQFNTTSYQAYRYMHKTPGTVYNIEKYTYISEWLGDGYTPKSLEKIRIGFEKIVSGNRGKIYIRTSKRDTWKQVADITEVDAEAKNFKNYLDGTVLPTSYRKIQFKVVGTGDFQTLYLGYQDKVKKDNE